MFSVTIREKSGQVYTFHFDKPEIMIGRVKGNDVILPKQNISKRHSLVRANADRFIIEDLGSTNGTYVNGHRIASPVEITSEDKVYLGDFVMQFFDLGDQFGSQPDSAEELPEVPDTYDAPPPSLDELHSAGHASHGHSGDYEAPLDSQVAGSQIVDAAENTVAELDSMAAVARLMAERRALDSYSEPDPAVAAEDPLAALENIDARMTGPMDDLNDSFAQPTDSEVPELLSESMDFPLPEHEVAPAPPLDLDDYEAPRPSPDESVFAPPAPEPTPIAELAPPPQPSEVALSGDHYEAVAALYAAAAQQLRGQLPHDASLLDDSEWQAMEGLVVRFVDATLAASEVPSGLDTARIKRDLIYEIAGLGPLEAMLDDPGVESIEVNGFDQIQVFRSGDRGPAEARFSSQTALLSAVERLVRATGLSLPDGATHAEGALADGTSVRVVWPPLCPNGPVLLLRKPRKDAPTVSELVSRGWIDSRVANALAAAVNAGRSIAICGPVGSGRRTVVNALGVGVDKSERIVVAEAGVRLALSQPHVVRIDLSVTDAATSGLGIALAMQPERLLVCVDEAPQVAELVGVSASGLPPWIGSFFAADADDLVQRAQRALVLAHPGISESVARDCVAATFDLIASLQPDGAGGFRMSSLLELTNASGAVALTPWPPADDSGA